IAVCPSPETFCNPLTVTLTLMVNVATWAVPLRAAFTVTGPAAEGEMVTLVETRPCALDVPVGELRVAAPAGVTLHVTPAPEMVLVPVASVTLATRGDAKVSPGLILTGLT